MSGLAELLAPERCLACRVRSSMPWCAPCWERVRALRGDCPRCAGARLAQTGHRCWPSEAPIDATRAIFDYRGPVAAAVRNAKLGGASAGWRALGVLLGDHLRRLPVPADVITWVTTPASRVRRRSIDHAEVLARVVGQSLDVPVVRLLDAAERRGRPADVYTYAGPAPLPSSDVLLVDDVITTGATIERAAVTLRGAGAGRIAAAVIARAGDHPLSG